MKEKITEILTDVKSGDLSVEDAQEQILNAFGVSQSSILCGGDDLSEYGERHRGDCERIKVILIRKGFANAGLNDAVQLWGEYSDSYAAGWLGLHEDDEDVYDSIKRYIRTTHSFD